MIAGFSIPKIKINGSVEIPSIGLGLSRVKKGSETINTVINALEVGYRLFDTAKFYGNEKDLGTAVKISGINREEIFIISKVWKTDLGYKKTLKAFYRTLKNLKMDYVDLYLIHFPADNYSESWSAMEFLLNEGKCRAIGVSNFGISELDSLTNQFGMVPFINQIQLNPFNTQKRTVDYCKNNHIQIIAHSPLARAQKLNDQNILNLSEKHKKTPAQIFIRWSFQNGYIPIPKTIQGKRMVENLDIFNFDLDIQDMIILDNLNENYHVQGKKEKLKKYFRRFIRQI